MGISFESARVFVLPGLGGEQGGVLMGPLLNSLPSDIKACLQKRKSPVLSGLRTHQINAECLQARVVDSICALDVELLAL